MAVFPHGPDWCLVVDGERCDVCVVHAGWDAATGSRSGRAMKTATTDVAGKQPRYERPEHRVARQLDEPASPEILALGDLLRDETARTAACPGCDAKPGEPHDDGCHGGEWGRYA